MSDSGFNPWADLVALTEATTGAYTITAIRQERDVDPLGDLVDVVEYTFLVNGYPGSYTVQVPFAQVEAGFGDFAVMGYVEIVKGIWGIVV